MRQVVCIMDYTFRLQKNPTFYKNEFYKCPDIYLNDNITNDEVCILSKTEREFYFTYNDFIKHFIDYEEYINKKIENILNDTVGK